MAEYTHKSLGERGLSLIPGGTFQVALHTSNPRMENSVSKNKYELGDIVDVESLRQGSVIRLNEDGSVQAISVDNPRGNFPDYVAIQPDDEVYLYEPRPLKVGEVLTPDTIRRAKPETIIRGGGHGNCAVKDEDGYWYAAGFSSSRTFSDSEILQVPAIVVYVPEA